MAKEITSVYELSINYNCWATEHEDISSEFTEKRKNWKCSYIYDEEFCKNFIGGKNFELNTLLMSELCLQTSK